MKKLILFLFIVCILLTEAKAGSFYTVEFLPTPESDRTINLVTPYALILMKLSPAKQIIGNTVIPSTGGYVIVERVFNPNRLNKDEILKAYIRSGDFFITRKKTMHDTEYSGFMKLKEKKIFDLNYHSYYYNANRKTIYASETRQVLGISAVRFDYFNLMLLIISAVFAIILLIILCARTVKDLIHLWSPNSRYAKWIKIEKTALRIFLAYREFMGKTAVLLIYIIVLSLGIVSMSGPNSSAGTRAFVLALAPLFLIVVELALNEYHQLKGKRILRV